MAKKGTLHNMAVLSMSESFLAQCCCALLRERVSCLSAYRDSKLANIQIRLKAYKPIVTSPFQTTSTRLLLTNSYRGPTSLGSDSLQIDGHFNDRATLIEFSGF